MASRYRARLFEELPEGHAAPSERRQDRLALRRLLPCLLCAIVQRVSIEPARERRVLEVAHAPGHHRPVAADQQDGLVLAEAAALPPGPQVPIATGVAPR